MKTVVRATDLYLLALCPHRIHLDRRLASSEASEPNPATRLLMDHGLAHEKAHSDRLGWPAPEYPPGDFEKGAEATLELMRQGVEGICQGVLREGRHLAIPDLLERAAGPSRLGGYHYRPGDIKSGIEPRADQALQVTFAAHLLEELQGVYPAEGYLILGDGRREDFSLVELRELLAFALSQVESILDGRELSTPFLCHACGSCPWREHCVSGFVSQGDLSLVDGMTPTRRRVLRREGVSSIEELAHLDLPRWRAAGLPPLALDRLIPQAKALCHGEIREFRRTIEVPEGAERALLIHAERNPLAKGEVSFLAWARYAPPAVPGAEPSLETPHIEIMLDEASRRVAMERLARATEGPKRPLLHFGSQVARTLGLLSDAAELAPQSQAHIEAQLWDLLLSIRRASAYLPVWRYDLDDVARILRGARPGTAPREEAAIFVLLEQLRRGTAGESEQEIREYGAMRLHQLRGILAWLLSHPTKQPRRACP